MFEGKILLVEDNLLNQKIAKIMLEDLGCDVQVVSNGDEAIKLIEKNPCDLVFMDIGLPGKDGVAITKEIRKNPLHKSLPIIALTAHALEQDIQKCYQATIERKRKDGSLVDVQIIGVPLIVSGKRTGTFGMYRSNITEKETGRRSPASSRGKAQAHF